MNRHKGRQHAILHKRHAEGCADADGLEGRGFLRRDLGQIVVDDQRPPGAQFLDRQFAEVGERVVADDALVTGGRPIAADLK